MSGLLEKYVPIVGAEVIDHLRHLAEPLRGSRVVHVNSTREGGGVAEIVGRLLHELGLERQVLCVTHLAQVAARADAQWRVAKTTRAGEVLSSIQLLDTAERVQEIARMLGGVELTEITLQHAQEMLARQ